MSKKLYNCMECHPNTSYMIISDREPTGAVFKDNCRPVWYCLGAASVTLKPDTEKEILEKRAFK